MKLIGVYKKKKKKYRKTSNNSKIHIILNLIEHGDIMSDHFYVVEIN